MCQGVPCFPGPLCIRIGETYLYIVTLLGMGSSMVTNSSACFWESYLWENKKQTLTNDTLILRKLVLWQDWWLMVCYSSNRIMGILGF